MTLKYVVVTLSDQKIQSVGIAGCMYIDYQTFVPSIGTIEKAIKHKS